MKNIVLRSITGIFIIVAIIGSILLGKYPYFIVFGIINFLALYEFYKTLENKKIHPYMPMALFTGIIMHTLFFFVAGGVLEIKWSLILIPMIAIIFISELFRKDPLFENVAFSLAGLIFIPVPLSFLHYLFFKGEGIYSLLLSFFILVWVYDTFAYLTGTRLGKNKLFKKITPKKTWEGFIGGVVFTILSAYGISFLNNLFSTSQWIIIAIIIVIFATFGDLVESMFKRNLETKDTGALLPGHGGFMDRFDSVFMAAPVIYVYIYFLT
ncbi:MAG: phosphatidate cytidylyltransferase [Bacteroidota bacterium]